MSEYWKKIPIIEKIKLNLKPIYGDGYLEATAQEGPQQVFISCMGGTSGEDLKDQDFPLIFYGGAR